MPTAEIFEGAQAEEWTERVRLPGYQAVIERVYVIRVEAFDWNCPSTSLPRFTAEQIREALGPIERQMRELTEENARQNARLREKLSS